PHSSSPLPMNNTAVVARAPQQAAQAQQPLQHHQQQQQYSPPDPNRMASPPNAYGQNVHQQHPQGQTSHHHSQSLSIPAYNTQTSAQNSLNPQMPQNVSPPNHTVQQQQRSGPRLPPISTSNLQTN